jgi:hypothetical protein
MALRASAANQSASRTTGGFYLTDVFSACCWIYLESDNNSFCSAWGLQDASNNYIYLYSANADGTTIGWEDSNANAIDQNVVALNTWTFFGIAKAGNSSNQATAYRRTISATTLTSTVGTLSARDCFKQSV